MTLHYQLTIRQLVIAVSFAAISMAYSQLINARHGDALLNVSFFFATCVIGGIAFGSLFRQSRNRAIAVTVFAIALFYLLLSFWLLPNGDGP